MGISMQESIVIKRPIEDVFAFVSNMENSPLYGRTIRSAKATDGPIAVGTEFHEELKLMGRVRTAHVEVTGYDLPTMFSYAGRIGNMSEKVSYCFEAVGEGTRTSMTGEGEMGILGELLAPMFSRMASKNAQSQLNRLRVALEAQNGADE